MALDSIDKQILDLLQQNARLSAAEIGDKVGLSASPCARRIRILEQGGYIESIVARLSADKVGTPVRVFVQVRLSQHQEKPVAQFDAAIEAMAEVISCHTVSGAFDYLLEVVVQDLPAYEHWVRRLQRLSMVNQIDSSFAIRTVKANGPLPIHV